MYFAYAAAFTYGAYLVQEDELPFENVFKYEYFKTLFFI